MDLQIRWEKWCVCERGSYDNVRDFSKVKHIFEKRSWEGTPGEEITSANNNSRLSGMLCKKQIFKNWNIKDDLQHVTQCSGLILEMMQCWTYYGWKRYKERAACLFQLFVEVPHGVLQKWWEFAQCWELTLTWDLPISKTKKQNPFLLYLASCDITTQQSDRQLQRTSWQTAAVVPKALVLWVGWVGVGWYFPNFVHKHQILWFSWE